MLNVQDVQRIAAEASCDPRTVRSFLEGKKTREMVKARIEAAMKKLKLRRS